MWILKDDGFNKRCVNLRMERSEDDFSAGLSFTHHFHTDEAPTSTIAGKSTSLAQLRSLLPITTTAAAATAAATTTTTTTTTVAATATYY